MTEQKWAPGPWDVDEDDFSIHQIETSDIVAECFGPVNDLLATARLIAAAPDLYAATDWVDEIKGFGKGMSEWIPVESVKDDEEFEITLSGAEIRALINARRKARGE